MDSVNRLHLETCAIIQIMKRITAFLMMLVYTCCLLFSQASSQNTASPEPYSPAEFPDWANQIRRTEIITLGSLPFTTLFVNTLFGLFRYVNSDLNPEYFPNPLAKSSSAANLSEKDQKNIFFTAVSVSVVVGLIDLVITLIKNTKKNEVDNRSALPDSVIIQKKVIQPVEPESKQDLDETIQPSDEQEME